MRKLSDSETWAIANALRVAATQYQADADTHRNAPQDALMHPDARARMVRGFEDQATMARKLAEELEGCSSVTIAS